MSYPRSFLGLLLAGFTLVALPLVGALAYSAWNTERLASQSRSAVFNASQAARASRSLVERIGSIERLAQQVAVLEDAELLHGYSRVHRSFRQLTDEIAQLPLDEAQLGALNRTIGHEQGLYDLLTQVPRGRIEAAEITERIDQLIDSAREVLAINNLIVDREVERLRASADDVQRGLILLLIFSTAVALTIALALTRYIARPIAAIDKPSGSSAARTFRGRSRCADPRICAISAGASTGCAGVSRSSRRRRTASCATFRTSSRRPSRRCAKARSC